MRTLMLALGAAAMAVPVATFIPTDTAEASPQRSKHKYREWRGRDGRTYCRRSDGTTGLVVGAVGGALLGTAVDAGVGTAIGAVGGALAGRAIERDRSKKRCR